MSEEIGKKLAAKYGQNVTTMNADSIANQDRAALNEQIQKKLKLALSGAVTSFNKNSGSRIILGMNDGGSQVIFTLDQKLTVTLIFKDQKIQVNPVSRNRSNILPYEVNVSLDAEGELNFRVIPKYPTITTPIRSQDAFVEEVVMIALEEKPD